MLNRLTFSLVSLILIIMGLVFVAAPAMAQTVQISDVTDPLVADGYLIIRNTTNAGLPDITQLTDTQYVDLDDGDLPNLEVLFNDVGGTILLNASRTAYADPDADPLTVDGTDFRFDSNGDADGGERDLEIGDLYITEIMWGVNKAAAGTSLYNAHQWIEVWNNTGQDIPAAVVNGLSLDFSYNYPAPLNANVDPNHGTDAGTDAPGKVTLDRVSNVVGTGWDVDLGQNGSDADENNENREPFISMYRDSENERGRQIGDGWVKSSWNQSTEVYLANHVGTPGAAERLGRRTFNPSDVVLTVVFNEIANFESDDADYEWIELRIRSGNPNFENWSVHIVTGDGDDDDKLPEQVELFTIPRLDTRRFEDILLITAKDPAGDPNHPLAAGYNVAENDGNQDLGIDRNIRYFVADWTTDLPDDGEFVLILRDGNDTEDYEKVQDIAGYHPNLTVDFNSFPSDTAETDKFNSNLWPLIAYSAPNRSHNKIESGEVARRVFDDIPGTQTKSGDHIDKVAFHHEDNGYTGVGYKRGAAPNNQHGGTPGYPNDVVKEKESDLAGAALVSISEIMYNTGKRSPPQWIEIYNGSKTEAINLNGWKLKIENERRDFEVDVYSAPTIEFGPVIIPPNRTVIVTSRPAREATEQIDRDQAIIDLWSTQRNYLEVDNRSYQLLSTVAFRLTLMEKGGGFVEAVGNLGADPAWELPMDADADGRVSVIRRYDYGEPRDGTMADGWVLASMTKRWYGEGETYYGDRNDIGTPGYRGGGVLPVNLSKFRPERLDSGEIVVRWVTESELNNAGFNILRSTTRDGEFTKLNTQLIAGHGTTSEKNAYEFVDKTAKPNVVYYYQIQDVSFDGNVTTLQTTHLRGNVSAAGKLTTTWGGLKTLRE